MGSHPQFNNSAMSAPAGDICAFDDLDSDGHSEGELDQEPDLQDLIDIFEVQDKCGPEVSSKLAAVMNSGIRAHVSDEKVKELVEKYLRPANCGNMTVPKVNPEVWGKLKMNTRSQDIRFQNTQMLQLKAMVPVIQILDQILEAKEKNQTLSPKALRPLAKDAVALMTIGFTNLAQRRRDLIKPDLSGAFKQLCGYQNPITEYLFGEDLSKQIKDISEAQKVAYSVTGAKQQFPKRSTGYQGYQGNRYQPYHKGGRANDKPFLKSRGQGRPQAWQARKNRT